MTKKRKFEYKERSKSTIERRASQGGGNFVSPVNQDIPVFSPSNEGDYVLRILPPTWEDPEHFGFDVYVHYSVGADNNNYICPQSMGQGPCPICEERNKASREGEEEYAKELRPTKRVATYVIDRDNEDDGPKIWLMPMTFDRDLSNQMIDKTSGEVLMIDHPEEGYDISFTRQGTGLNTTYAGKQISRRSSPISKDEETMEEWLDFIEKNPIPDQLNIYSYEDINLAFSGAHPSEDEEPSSKHDEKDEEEEDTPPFDTEEDEEDDEDDEDEAEDRRSRRGRRRRTSGLADKMEADD